MTDNPNHPGGPGPEQPQNPPQPNPAPPPGAAPPPQQPPAQPQYQQPQYQQPPQQGGYPQQPQQGGYPPQGQYQQPPQGYQQQPQGEDDAEVSVPDFLKAVRGRHLAAFGIGFGVLYGILVVVGLLTVIGLQIGDVIGSGAVFDSYSAPWAFFTFPFQFAGLWLFGVFGHADYDGGMWAPNIILLVIAAFVAIKIARKFGNKGEEPLENLAWGAKILLVAALSLAAGLLTLLLSFALAYRGDGGTQSVTGFALFFGAFLTYLTVAFLIATPVSLLSRIGRIFSRFLPAAGGAWRVVAVHFLIIAIPAWIYTIIFFGVEVGPVGWNFGSEELGAAGILTFFAWMSQAAIGAFVVLNSGGVSEASVAAELFGETTSDDTLSFYTGHFAWWEVLVSILLGLIALFAASLSWRLVRDNRKQALANPLSWATLPTIYLLVAVIFTFFGRYIFTDSFNLGPAWWTFALFIVIGVVIDVLSRFVSPFIVGFLPGSIKKLLAVGKPHEFAGATAPQRTQQQPGYPPQQPPQHQGGYQQPPQHGGYPQQPGYPPQQPPQGQPPQGQPPQHGQPQPPQPGQQPGYPPQQPPQQGGGHQPPQPPAPGQPPAPPQS
ncbi:hypothetical protein [Nesterenkonia sedimenti]|uniref:hypothetical protein n=1 Tax=Nesterenkonia sedimenti TaxID=1463632 RepID=UPI001B3B2D64|nr:hypothetical protein [Nesterenkonia sedimenti]